MDFTPEHLLFLANSAEFEKVVASDPVLDEIEASRIDYALERLLLFEAVRGLLHSSRLSLRQRFQNYGQCPV